MPARPDPSGEDVIGSGTAQKPRHVPSFCVLKKTYLEQLIHLIACPLDISTVFQRYELGTIGLRRYAVTHQDQVDSHIEDYSKSITRISNNGTERPIITLGFTGRSKRWTLCPSSKCILRANKRDKIVGQWKILRFSLDSLQFKIPDCIYKSYGPVADNDVYFAATVCPRQTYCSKHSNQATFMNPNWHYNSRHKYALQDILLFADPNQYIRAAWRLRTLNDKYKPGCEEAEKALIRVMNAVFRHIKNEARQNWNICSLKRQHEPEPNKPSESTALFGIDNMPSDYFILQSVNDNCDTLLTSQSSINADTSNFYQSTITFNPSSLLSFKIPLPPLGDPYHR